MRLVKSFCDNDDAFDLMLKYAPKVEKFDGVGGESFMLCVMAASLAAVPGGDILKASQTINDFADAARLPREKRNPRTIVESFQTLFGKSGFSEAPQQFRDSPENYSLVSVLENEKMQGNSAILAILYKLVGMKLGLRVWGIALRNYYICRVDDPPGKLLVAPSDGGQIKELDWVKRTFFQRNRGDTWSNKIMVSLSNRQWIDALLIDIFEAHRLVGSKIGMAKTQELSMILSPEDSTLCLEQARLLVEIGNFKGARELAKGHLDQFPKCKHIEEFKALLVHLAASD